jgi:hypothetical protein
MALFGENYGTIRVEKWLEKKEVLASGRCRRQRDVVLMSHIQ